MAFFENVAGGVEPHGHRVDLSWFHQFLLSEGIAEAGTADPIGNIQIKATRPVFRGGTNIDEIGSEVRID